MTEETKLLPCPFCGTEPTLVCEGGFVTVACTHYYCNFSQIALQAQNRQKAIDRWNTRAPLSLQDRVASEPGREWLAGFEEFVLQEWRGNRLRLFEFSALDRFFHLAAGRSLRQETASELSDAMVAEQGTK